MHQLYFSADHYVNADYYVPELHQTPPYCAIFAGWQRRVIGCDAAHITTYAVSKRAMYIMSVLFLLIVLWVHSHRLACVGLFQLDGVGWAAAWFSWVANCHHRFGGLASQRPSILQTWHCPATGVFVSRLIWGSIRCFFAFKINTDVKHHATFLFLSFSYNYFQQFTFSYI